jgi:16S rRNA (guanine1516-N2)-methyltransferase
VEPSFQRYLSARSERIREQGKDVDIPEMKKVRIAVGWEGETQRPYAQSLSRRLELPMTGLAVDGYDMLLVAAPSGLELRQIGKCAPGPVRVDFVQGGTGHRGRSGEGRGQPLGRAVGLKKGWSPHLLDATAGLGRDAFVLASLGCRVLLMERSPVAAALLADGIDRASRDPRTGPIVRLMKLRCEDAIDCMRRLPEAACPDVVYLDPMYPHRKKTALVRKEMRIFRQLVGDDTDSKDLLDAARKCARFRVVVKRPARFAPLAGVLPDMEIKSPNTRYDVYVNCVNRG